MVCPAAHLELGELSRVATTAAKRRSNRAWSPGATARQAARLRARSMAASTARRRRPTV
jgi:hypothetical protein